MPVPLYVVHTALLLSQLLAAMNTIVARTALSWRDGPEDEMVTPQNLAVGRSVIAMVLMMAAWMVRRAHQLTRRQDLSSSSSSPMDVVVDDAARCGEPVKSPRSAGKWFQAVVLADLSIRGRDVWYVAGLGVLGIPVNLLCFLNGVARTDAVTAGAFACSTPMVCFLIARVLGTEPLTVLKLCALGLVVAGNVVLIQIWTLFGGSESSRDGTYYTGCLFLVGNVCAWSSYLVLQRPLFARVERLDFLAWYYISGTVALLMFVCVAQPASLLHQFITVSLTRWSWYSICYSGFLNATVAYYLISFGIHHGGSILTSAWNSAQPLFVAVFATVLLGEQMTTWRIVGGIGVLGGIIMSVLAHVQTAKVQQTASQGKEGGKGVEVLSGPADDVAAVGVLSMHSEDQLHMDVLEEIPMGM